MKLPALALVFLIVLIATSVDSYSVPNVGNRLLRSLLRPEHGPTLGSQGAQLLNRRHQPAPSRLEAVSDDQKAQKASRFVRTGGSVTDGKMLRALALPALTVGAAVLTASQPTMATSAATLFNSLKTQANDSGFLQAFLLIFVSEIGDKTFFIAGLLAAKYGKLISFSGSMGALAVMTIISTVLGQLFHAVPPSLTQGLSKPSPPAPPNTTIYLYRHSPYLFLYHESPPFMY